MGELGKWSGHDMSRERIVRGKFPRSTVEFNVSLLCPACTVVRKSWPRKEKKKKKKRTNK